MAIVINCDIFHIPICLRPNAEDCLTPNISIEFLTGWWFQPTPLKNDGVNVTWDDEIPN